ncbi:polymeric immunoglobulin receptor-like isoform X2 [Ictalurus furcatus]|uniref:polymeric immunoglobulin receptor-like isoform X2 n=1 Tax=Ictalurus furcatus TaxID=66913 RepID=UPI002350BA87|nr:polymeric immunoglobulin receptor-like isoform X2 [Ictalurus furcatus]
MHFYSLVGSGILFGFFLCISDVQSMRTLKNVAVKHGGSVTIPCLYEDQYKPNPKFWCKGYFWSSCSIEAYANSIGSTSVTDYLAQDMFTVELNPVSDSGTYWCAAEIGSKWTQDDYDYLYLTVSQDPDLSVKESRVSAEEGGSITVQCLYSAAYQNTQKQWCRFKDNVCNTFRSTDTSQKSAVQVSDDGRGSFSVQMSGLKKSDAGWYWCSAGDLQVPVHISVGDEAPGISEKKEEHKTSPIDDTILALCIISGLFLVLIVTGCVIWKRKQKHILNKGASHSPINTDVVYDDVVLGQPQSIPNKSPKEREDAVIYSTVVDGQCKASSASEQEVTYSTVRTSHHPTVSPVPPNDKVIYSSVKSHT